MPRTGELGRDFFQVSVRHRESRRLQVLRVLHVCRRKWTCSAIELHQKTDLKFDNPLGPRHQQMANTVSELIELFLKPRLRTAHL